MARIVIYAVCHESHTLPIEGPERRGERTDYGRAGSLRDHQELNQRQDRENHRADDIVAANDELAERLNDFSRMPFRQRQAG